MKKAAPLLVLTAALAFTSVVRADYEITMSITSPGSPKPKEMVTKIKGERMRTDLGEGSVSITDRKTGQRMLLHEKTKQATDLSAFTQSLQEGDKDKPKPKPVATGKKETVAGYSAEEYTYDLGEDTKVALWVAPDYPKDQAAVLKHLYESSASRAMAEAPDMSALPGAVIRSVVKSKDGATEIDAVIKSVKEVTVDDNEFEIPADYTVKKLPARPGARKGAK